MAHRPVAETRQELIRAALTVVARDGVQGATTRAIVQEAGMSLATFHYAFASRDELMGELVHFALGAEQEAIEPAFADENFDPEHPPTALEHACIAFRNYVDSLMADPDREKALFELALWAISSNDYVELARHQYRQYDEIARAAVESLTALTGIRWRMPLDDVCRFLVTMTDGLTLSWLIYRDDAQIYRLADAAARGLVAQAVEPGQRGYDELPEPDFKLFDPEEDPAALMARLSGEAE